MIKQTNHIITKIIKISLKLLLNLEYLKILLIKSNKLTTIVIFKIIFCSNLKYC